MLPGCEYPEARLHSILANNATEVTKVTLIWSLRYLTERKKVVDYPEIGMAGLKI